MSLIEQRAQTLLASFNPERQLSAVSHWVAKRPSFPERDADLDFMGGKCIPGEVKEVKAEFFIYGTERYSPILHGMEQADVYFFMLALVASRNLDLDWAKIVSHINGVGAGSSAYEKMIEVSVNMSDRSLEPDVSALFQLLLSNSAAMPHPFNMDKFLKIVLEKNSGNYPAYCFSKYHPDTKKLLNPAELEQMNTHARRCLRIIRDFRRNVIGEDFTGGMEDLHVKPYLELIRYFPKSQSAQKELELRLYADNHLPVPQNPVL